MKITINTRRRAFTHTKSIGCTAEVYILRTVYHTWPLCYPDRVACTLAGLIFSWQCITPCHLPGATLVHPVCEVRQNIGLVLYRNMFILSAFFPPLLLSPFLPLFSDSFAFPPHRYWNRNFFISTALLLFFFFALTPRNRNTAARDRKESNIPPSKYF